MQRPRVFPVVRASVLLVILLLAGCGGQVQVSITTLTPAGEPTAAATTALAVASPTPAPPTMAPTTAPTSGVVPTVTPPQAATAAATGQPGAAEVELRQWATSATASSEYSSPDWAASQAIGAPDTLRCEDVETAWASGAASGIEWLELWYATPVRPTAVNIIQSYSPGQVVRVDLLDTAGTYHTIYSGEPQEVPTCPYVFSLPVEAAYQAAGVRLTLDQTERSDWTEIDAVELVGWTVPGGASPTVATPAAGRQEIRQWGDSARAGSEYGSSDYSASQGAGPPDTLTCGDNVTAWAPAVAGSVDWLEVRYATPVQPTQVQILQTYNPGAVVIVELLDTTGTWHEIYTALPDLESTCPATLSIDVSGADYRAIAVRITVDQSASGDWAEIDAVELVGWTD